jgi:repressor LexA
MTKQDTLRKMNEMLSFINSFSADKGYPPSVREISKEMGIKSTASVYYYLKMLEDNGLIKKEGTKNRAIQVIKPLEERFGKKNLTEIPLVGRIAAGEPILATENMEDIYSLSADLFGLGELFMLRVQGESMINAGILDGDRIIVKSQPTAENGQIAVAMIDGNATVKRFYKQSDCFILHPENNTMRDIVVKEVDILGVVVGLIRKI